MLRGILENGKEKIRARNVVEGSGNAAGGGGERLIAKLSNVNDKQRGE